MAKQLDLKKSIRGLTFLTKMLPYFGGKPKAGDVSVFDQRGAVYITDQEYKKKNGEIVKIRGVKEAGGGVSMAITRPGSGQTVDAARAMDAHKNWPYAAIKAISDEIASIEWRAFNAAGEELEEHEILTFLDSVNDCQTGPEFKKVLSDHLELTGNAYILLLGKSGAPVASYEEVPQAMHLLDPSRVKIKLNKTTYPYKVSGYTFQFDQREHHYLPEQIVHIKLPDPSNPYLGLGTVQGIAEWIDNDNNSTEMLRNFFKNGAQLGVVFETEMSSEEQLQELSDSFNEQKAGVHNGYKSLFLPKGVKKPTTDTKFGDIGLPAITDTNRDRILAGFRVPKTILGAAESETNRATAETADYVFARRTIKPKMLLICSYLNEFLSPRFGDDVYLSFDDPVTQDKAAQSEQMKGAVGQAPVMTVNEARHEYLGLEPVDGGDAMLTLGSLVPIQDAGKYGDPTMLNHRKTLLLPGETPHVHVHKSVAGKIRPRPAYTPARASKGKTQFAKNAAVRKEATKSLADAIFKIITDVKKKAVNDMTSDEYDTVILKEKRDRYTKFAERMRDELRKLNDQQKREVLANLKDEAKAFDTKAIGNLFDMAKWISITVSAVKPIMAELFTKEGDHAFNLIDKPGVDLASTSEGKQAITAATDLMADSYQKSTRDLLEAKLAEGLAQEYSIDKLAELVQDIYAWKDEYAAERVALTESNRITNAAGKMAWEKSGVVEEIKWVTSKRDNVCPICEDLDGYTISIKENFYDKGDEMVGGTVNDYSDMGGPPAHPNCHCGIKPVVTASKTAEPDSEVDEALKELNTLEHE